MIAKKRKLIDMKRIVLLFILFITFVSSSFAHSGRTDSNGGHYNRSTGEYHYHNDIYEVEYDEYVEEDEGSNEKTGELMVGGDDEYVINLRNENQELQEELNELKYAQEEIEYELQNRGVKDIYELGDKIDEQNSTIDSLNFICIVLIIIIGFVIYKGVKFKNKVDMK